MKKLLLFLLPLAMVVSCSKDEEPVQKVGKFTIDYILPQSGSMTKSGEDLYNDFYEKYIKTKIVTPKRYDITFINKDTGYDMQISGVWGDNATVILPYGKYIIQGNSLHPFGVSQTPAAYDTLRLSFGGEIVINEESGNITLEAQYDSYMLMFNKQGNSVTYFTNKEHYNVASKDNIYYFFGYKGMPKSSEISITKDNGNIIGIEIGVYQFENGIYYYFDDVDHIYNIPPMSPGL